jgi:dolichol kinase
MPVNKHKRKASAHPKPAIEKHAQPTGLIISHPRTSISVGLFFITLGIYLLAFESQDNAMFGFAMLSFIVGVATTIYAKFTVPKKKNRLG